MQAEQNGRRQSRGALLLRHAQEMKTVEEDLISTLDRMIEVLEQGGQGGRSQLIALLDLQIRRSAYQLQSLRLQRNIELDLIWFRARSGWYATMDARTPYQKPAGVSDANENITVNITEGNSLANTAHHKEDKP